MGTSRCTVLISLFQLAHHQQEKQGSTQRRGPSQPFTWGHNSADGMHGSQPAVLDVLLPLVMTAISQEGEGRNIPNGVHTAVT